MRLDNGTITHDRDEILNKWRQDYKQSFRDTENDLFDNELKRGVETFMSELDEDETVR